MSSATQQMNLYSLSRIALTLGPGLGFLMYLHSSTLNQRPDILDRYHLKILKKIKLPQTYYYAETTVSKTNNTRT